MAKIQYIRSSSSDYDRPDSASSLKKPKPERTDPGMKIALIVGSVSAVIAIVCIFLAISASQRKGDVEDLLRRTLSQRIDDARLTLSSNLDEEALQVFSASLGAVKRALEDEKLTVKKVNSFTEGLWTQILQKRASRGLYTAIVRDVEALFETPPDEVAKAVQYFENEDNTIVVTEEFDEGASPLFPIMNLSGNNEEGESEPVPTGGGTQPTFTVPPYNIN
ncbi:MAG: hypothetical protein U5N86_09665 [Planctomycetota bacterium]|nr:hypothetical protein [Planctomycetota bacterium]